MWPSKYSRYTVAQTPDKRDIIGELVEACRKEGVDVHLYYSILDWSHPDYRSAIKNEEDAVAFGRFLDFAENQLKELATRYPTVKDFGLMVRGIVVLNRWEVHGVYVSNEC